MRSIQIVLIDCFKALGVNLHKPEFNIDSNYHQIKSGNKSVYYVIDMFFPYIAIYGFQSKECNVCSSLVYEELSAEHQDYYKDAEERLTSLYRWVKKGKIVDVWGNTNIDIDEYEVKHKWPVPNPNFCLEELLTILEVAVRKFVDIDTIMASVITLWIVFTWTVQNYDTSPLLIIKNDDDHYDSKYALLRLIMLLTRSAVRASAVGTNTFLEEYDYKKHTVLFDDPSAIRNRELLNLLINSHTRSDATKFIKKKNRLSPFDTFGAKTLICDGDIPKSLMQNGITIHLGLQHLSSRPLRINESDQYLLDNIRYGLEYFDDHYGDLLVKQESNLPDYLSNSEKENWEPLFEIATIAGDTWVKKAEQAAQAMTSALNQDIIIRQQLLIDAYTAVKDRNSRKIRTKTLISRLCSFTDKPWATYDRGDNITPEQLAKMLKKFGIKSKNMRFKRDQPVKKGYEKCQILEAYKALLADQGEHDCITHSSGTAVTA